ncbi:MAG TPA: GNAT family N-acetyltransferase [Chloroflexi bacterium]|jgi:GNAT superfamily N-acetyltransferase|nr:GNAT family N-acetyltransferase [Chloroflexota bacterium]
MKRREVELERDYDRLLEMQRLSWAINFPDYGFNADAFRVSLRSGVRRHEVYVYEEDDEMVGWLWLDTTSSSTSGHIKHIQVEQAHWGRGVGRRILEDAIAMCLDAGLRALTLNVTKSNERAMNLYAHMGFVVMDEDRARQRMRLDLHRRGRPGGHPDNVGGNDHRGDAEMRNRPDAANPPRRRRRPFLR